MAPWVDATVLVVAGCLTSSGCKGDGARSDSAPVSEASTVSASPSPLLGQPGAAPPATASLDAEAATDAVSLATPVIDKRDVAKLKACCRTFERMGRAKPNEEGAGLIGLATVCNEMAASLAQSEAPELNGSDWEAIHAVLDGSHARQDCRKVLLQFEKK